MNNNKSALELAKLVAEKKRLKKKVERCENTIGVLDELIEDKSKCMGFDEGDMVEVYKYRIDCEDPDNFFIENRMFCSPRNRKTGRGKIVQHIVEEGAIIVDFEWIDDYEVSSPIQVVDKIYYNNCNVEIVKVG